MIKNNDYNGALSAIVKGFPNLFRVNQLRGTRVKNFWLDGKGAHFTSPLRSGYYDHVPDWVDIEWEKDFFRDFANGTTSFGYLVQSISHEYVHAEIHLELFGRKAIPLTEEDELVATYTIMMQQDIPAMKQREWVSLIGMYEGYLNSLPKDVQAKYQAWTNHVIKTLKPKYGMEAKPDPTRKPPALYQRSADGTIKKIRG
jgi:hypothetical protein